MRKQHGEQILSAVVRAVVFEISVVVDSTVDVFTIGVVLILVGLGLCLIWLATASTESSIIMPGPVNFKWQNLPRLNEGHKHLNALVSGLIVMQIESPQHGLDEHASFGSFDCLSHFLPVINYCLR